MNLNYFGVNSILFDYKNEFENEFWYNNKKYRVVDPKIVSRKIDFKVVGTHGSNPTASESVLILSMKTLYIIYDNI